MLRIRVGYGDSGVDKWVEGDKEGGRRRQMAKCKVWRYNLYLHVMEIDGMGENCEYSGGTAS